MDIQPAAPRHFDALQRLLTASGLPTEDLTPSHLEHFFVAEAGETLVGVAGMERYGDVALLRSLAVSAPHRGEGVGARLTDAVEQHARREGVRELYLLTTTAAGYFEQRGYRRIERGALPRAIQTTDEAARLCPSSATCMRKRVGDASGESL